MIIRIVLDNSFGVCNFHYLWGPNFSFGPFADVAPSLLFSWRF